MNCTEESKEEFSKTLTFIGRKWTLLILKEFCSKETMRFLEIKENVGDINSKLLSSRLKELESLEILDREVFKELPPRVEYTLTKKGYELVECIRVLGEWTYKWTK